ncbi:tyrosine-protein phosphatase Lar-like [Pocillopora verrucosa]|uniref:tyrosine-protein phosphatase Lar-like n=1 Tax=Pocillopora verrucosa TaxID=203993 RepID=UPI003340F362
MTAMVAVFFYIFSFIFLVLHIVTKTKPTDVKIPSYCKGAIGLKDVDIIWRPLGQRNSSSWAVYRISYCPLFPSCTENEQYQLGCILNTTQHQLQKELQCRMTEESLFPKMFYYIVELQNLSGVFISQRLTCRLITKVHCTRPQNLTAKAVWKRTMSLSWKPAPFFGRYTNILCYRIWYAAAHDKKNESVQITLGGESRIIDDLSPYTEYKFYIQCSLSNCEGSWGLVDGPVTAQTLEEAPTQAPQFSNWSVTNTQEEERDVTVVWQLPPLITWNGVPNRFNIDYWKTTKQNDSSVPIPNSIKSLQINDSSATEATLRGLNRYVEYQTQISMCTAEGCGPKSVPWPLEGEEAGENEPYVDSLSLDSRLIWIVLVVTVILFGVVMAAIYLYRNYRVRRQQPPLRQRIQLEPLYGDLENSASTSENSYYDHIHSHGDLTDPQLIIQDGGDLNCRV